MSPMSNTFQTRTTLDVEGKSHEIYSLKKLGEGHDIARLPYALKILLENLLRNENGVSVSAADIEALVAWDPKAEPATEIAFTPARVILQDFTGVPSVVDLAAMRDAVGALGGDLDKVNPLAPAELVIDHSVQVDNFGSPDALARNAEIEFQRNRERYAFLRWGQQAFEDFQVVPPDTGIVHQVNLEYLARVVFERRQGGARRAFPDTVVGTDSHTTMVNGLGVLGWGVGGIEAEAAMLGQPITMLIPQVVGFRLGGRLPAGATATDLVLTVVAMLRARGVVGKFVEFFGDGLDHLPLADRATIANMAPEYGATCGIFPIDKETLRYLELTGRPAAQRALIESYAREQGLLREAGGRDAEYSDLLELDMSTVEPCIAGPKRPQDRITLKSAKSEINAHLGRMQSDRDGGSPTPRKVQVAGARGAYELADGAVIIAAITSCTNTSNPSVMVGAGLLARKARALGLRPKPWVKTSLAPGSQVVAAYLRKADLLEDLEALGYHLVGFGCTTCIGNSGPLPAEVGDAVRDNDLIACSVLSGNRNFEGRIHAQSRMNFIASPPLVVAYAIAGRVDIDFANEALGEGPDGKPVYLRDLWPSAAEIQDTIARSISAEMFRDSYHDVFNGDARWRGIEVAAGRQYRWDDGSTYVRNPPYFVGMGRQPAAIGGIRGARVLALLGDSITTDHISPAGAIAPDGPAGRYLVEHGVEVADFNSFGSRRGNHEVMMRGTFANIRLRNQLAPGTEGGWTRHQPSGELMSIYDAAVRYREQGVPLVVLAGTEYGTGSSRDWAAKGTLLLGVKAVISCSFERIHRSNLVGMGVLPLQFKDGENAATLGLTGLETYDFGDLQDGAKEITVTATAADGGRREFVATVRIDTPMEWDYYRHGGILQYVVRQLAA